MAENDARLLAIHYGIGALQVHCEARVAELKALLAKSRS